MPTNIDSPLARRIAAFAFLVFIFGSTFWVLSPFFASLAWAGILAYVTFTDGSARDIDLEPFLHGPLFDPIRQDPEFMAHRLKRQTRRAKGGTSRWCIFRRCGLQPHVAIHLRTAIVVRFVTASVRFAEYFLNLMRRRLGGDRAQGVHR